MSYGVDSAAGTRVLLGQMPLCGSVECRWEYWKSEPRDAGGTC